MIVPPASHGLLPPAFTAEDLPLTLRFGGHRCLLRPLQLDDVAHLLAFFASHTSETIYQRYGYFFATMTPEHAARLVGVDQSRDAALGVFELRGETTRLIAIGRYCLEADGRNAEVAFVVHEERRNLGIAGTLLRVLATIAAERGLEALVAQVEHDNTPMLAVFRRAGARLALIPGTPSLHVTLALRAPDPTSVRARPSRPRASWLSRTAARTALELERASVALQRLPTL